MRIVYTLLALLLGATKLYAQDSLAFQKEQNGLDIQNLNQFHINQNDRFGQFGIANEGAAIQNMIFGLSEDSLGFKTNAYQGYIRNKEHFLFSRYDRFTRLNYMPANDEGQYISAYHSQQFKQFSFGLDYSKILSEGFFINQKARHATTSLLVKYHPEKSRYSANVYARYNTISSQENGGLASDSLYINEAFSNEKVYPVRLDKAKIEQWNTTLELNQKYDLRKENSFSNYSYLSLRSNYRNQEELYTDENPDFQANVEGTIIANYYPSILDTDETNDSIGFQTFGHQLEWHYGIKAVLDAKVGYGIQFDNFTTGIFTENQDRQALNLEIDVLKSLVKYTFHSEKSTLFNERANSWSLASQIVKDFEVGYEYTERFPELFMRSYSGNHLSWMNDFKHTESQRLYAFVKDSKQKFKIQANYYSLNNWIYYNELARPEQKSEKQELIQVEVSKRFKWKKWGATLKAVWQETDSEIMRLPDWTTRLQVYHQSVIFGKNDLQVGAQVNYFSAYNAPSYMAATSVFYIADEVEIGNYPMVDLFLNVRVKSLKAFLKYENINGLFSDKDIFIAPHYTWVEPRIKFGLNWNFYDK